MPAAKSPTASSKGPSPVSKAPPPGFKGPPPVSKAPPPGFKGPPPVSKAPPPGYKAAAVAPPPGFKADASDDSEPPSKKARGEWCSTGLSGLEFSCVEISLVPCSVQRYIQ